MTRKLLLSCLLVTSPALAHAELLTKTVGKLTITADTALARPGGVLIVRLRPGLGTTYAILNGRRAPFLQTPRGPRALLPIPADAPTGPTALGIELIARRGRQRIQMDLILAPRVYTSRTVVIPEAKRALITNAASVPDGRRLLQAIRTLTPEAQWNAPFVAPVAFGAQPTFGEQETFVGGSPVDTLTDATWGEYHRGADFEVPIGTPVQAPAPGTVIFAGPLTMTGQTLVLDHGQGLVSVFYHLSALEKHEGDHVEARGLIGLSGDSGLAASPHLHWGTYIHGIAVDPAVVQQLPE
jgi:murein DD-endopeptidase MepM/ murein hydrolase activator NlpD